VIEHAGLGGGKSEEFAACTPAFSGGQLITAGLQ
jgi:hypothetical protein